MKAEVAIIDGGGANIASLRFALDRLGAQSRHTTNAADIQAASHVILPGVGAAAAAMSKLCSHGLEALIPTLTQPVLGICLGMQLLAARSDEDDAQCLAVFPDAAEKLVGSPDAPVPNMGWCQTKHLRRHELFEGIDDRSWFYFVHSYALPVGDRTVGTSKHVSEFSAVVSQGNFHAVQFHPERSSSAGARLLNNFLQMQS